MAENQINNTTPKKKRTPTKPPATSALGSPTTPFFLGSNDDQRERPEARAAGAAAAIRLKGMASVTTASTAPPDHVLTKDQIIELFHNCIKLASENKITQKNTWELKLIDHLSELIKVESEDDAEVDFQKASCTLEAGVKIYSFRVDSAYSEAFKVLGGIIRAVADDQQEETVERVDKEPATEETERKISLISTIEQSLETLNVKKFDVAFAADPLHYQTSAQFDEGGAKGLLLNNLGVNGDCRLLFDSMEVPEKCISCSNQHDNSHIDISFCRECIEQMVINMPRKNHISPSLSSIIRQYYADNQFPSHETEDQKSTGRADAVGDSYVRAGAKWSVDLETATYSYDEETRFVDDGLIFEDTTAVRQHQENDSNEFCQPDLDENFQEFAAFIFQGLGFPSKINAWAGPDHWKFSKHKVSEDVPVKESRSGCSTESSKHNKPSESDLNFSNCLDQGLSHIFAPPRVPRMLLLPLNRQPFQTKLPEDCHYQPEDLVNLFLLPNIQILGNRQSQQPDGNTSWKCNTFGDQVLPGSNECGFGRQADGGIAHSNLEDSLLLVSQACQVTKIDVQYDNTSKEVDVQVLKETLWDHIQAAIRMPEMVNKDQLSFKHVLATFPCDCPAALPGDISPHLCFICLLHLANEQSLNFKGCPNLDDLTVCLPSSCVNLST